MASKESSPTDNEMKEARARMAANEGRAKELESQARMLEAQLRVIKARNELNELTRKP